MKATSKRFASPFAGIPIERLQEEKKLETLYLPVLMKNNVSVLLTSGCFTVHQIAANWKSFPVDMERSFLYTASRTSSDFIDYWEERQIKNPPKGKPDEDPPIPPMLVSQCLSIDGFWSDVAAYVSFKIMDAKLQNMRFVDLRVLAQAIAWKSNRINDACIYQCLGKALKENVDKFNPENSAEFLDAVVQQLKQSWEEVAAPEFASMREMLLRTVEPLVLVANGNAVVVRDKG